MKLDGKYYINRKEYMNWCQGILMDRVGTTVIATNDLECEEIDKALERGETVYLTVNGNTFSTIKNNGEAFVEEELK